MNKRPKFKAYTLALFLIGLTLLGSTMVFTNASIHNDRIIKKVYSSYTTHDPIEISKDSDFLAYATSGSGTQNDPYIISGFNITSTSEYGIYIHSDSVTSFFVIKDNYINASKIGIEISQVNDNITIIENNTITNCNVSAIFLDNVNGVNIKNNKLSWDNIGINVDDSTFFNITNNKIEHINNSAILFTYTSAANTTLIFSNNTISQAKKGITIYKELYPSVNSKYKDQLTFLNNSISYVEKAIEIFKCQSFNIINNYFYHATAYAIYFYAYYSLSNYSSYIIRNNNFEGSKNPIHFEQNANSLLIYNNTMTNWTGFGIDLTSSNATIQSNILINNITAGTAIKLEGTNYTITDNILYGGGISLSEVTDSYISRNKINCSNEYIINSFESVNTEITENDIYGYDTANAIYLYSANDTIIKNNAISHVDEGIELYADSARFLINISIINNIIDNAERAIIDFSGHNIDILNIAGNVILKTQIGIELDVDVNYLQINNNSINVFCYGISISQNKWENGIISNNTVVLRSNDNIGFNIYLQGSIGGTITGNVLLENITLEEAKADNWSIFGHGLLVILSSENLVIYSNYLLSAQIFVRPTIFHLAKDTGTNNTWYNSTINIGNYWGGFNGSGQYPIYGTANSYDLYPIIFPDTDGDKLDNYLETNLLGTSPSNPDTDGDGMPDGWEVYNSTNPLINDANADSDNDSLSNLGEYQHNTDPTNADTDGDGMPDGWEVQYNLNPLIDDSQLDPDNDSLTNSQEYIYHTDPHNNDTDGDGYGDGWEVHNNYDPLDPNSHPPETSTTSGIPFSVIGSIIGILILPVIATFVIRKRKTNNNNHLISKIFKE